MRKKVGTRLIIFISSIAGRFVHGQPSSGTIIWGKIVSIELRRVFGFVNAKLFATFFLGMFWKRTTSDGHFWEFISGTASTAVTNNLWADAGGRGGWIAVLNTFKSATGQAFTIATIAWVLCLIVAILISVAKIPSSRGGGPLQTTAEAYHYWGTCATKNCVYMMNPSS